MAAFMGSSQFGGMSPFGGGGMGGFGGGGAGGAFGGMPFKKDKATKTN